MLQRYRMLYHKRSMHEPSRSSSLGVLVDLKFWSSILEIDVFTDLLWKRGAPC